MITCSKTYKDIPFAHRQPRHDGHCSFIHGHNWTFEFEFIANELDENGFVIDFGKLKFIKDYLQIYDHALVIPEYDIELPRFKELANLNLVKLVVIPDTSAEGLAYYLWQKLNNIVTQKTNNRVQIRKVTVFEDFKNWASYEIEN